MTFIARLNHPEGRIRLYVHAAGSTLYGATLENAVSSADRHAQEVIAELAFFAGFDYFLGVLWGDQRREQRMFELWGFSDIRNWKESNPDVAYWQFRNGIATPYIASTGLTCGDTLIMLGEEEKYRRTTPNLETYLRGSPDLGPLEPTTQM